MFVVRPNNHNKEQTNLLNLIKTIWKHTMQIKELHKIVLKNAPESIEIPSIFKINSAVWFLDFIWYFVAQMIIFKLSSSNKKGEEGMMFNVTFDNISVIFVVVRSMIRRNNKHKEQFDTATISHSLYPFYTDFEEV